MYRSQQKSHEADDRFRIEIDRLRAAIIPPSKGTGFQLTVQALHEARVHRSKIEQSLRAACLVSEPSRVNIEKLNSELAAATNKVKACRAALDNERAKYEPKVMAAICPHLTVAKVVISELLDLLDDAVGVLADAHNSAAVDRVAVPMLLQRAPSLQAEIRALRQIVGAT